MTAVKQDDLERMVETLLDAKLASTRKVEGQRGKRVTRIEARAVGDDHEKILFVETWTPVG